MARFGAMFGNLGAKRASRRCLEATLEQLKNQNEAPRGGGAEFDLPSTQRARALGRGRGGIPPPQDWGLEGYLYLCALYTPKA